MEEGKATVTGC